MGRRSLPVPAIAVGVVSVAFSVVGPRILGRATDLIFTGLISKELPAGADPADVIAQLRADGQEQFADMLSGMTLTPGEGIDFGRSTRPWGWPSASSRRRAADVAAGPGPEPDHRRMVSACAAMSRRSCTACRWPTSTG